MKKKICLILLVTINLISAQKKENDYFTFYKGGEKYLKPIKYLLFDSNQIDKIKKEDKGQIYFQIKKERFRFDLKKNISLVI